MTQSCSDTGTVRYRGTEYGVGRLPELNRCCTGSLACHDAMMEQPKTHLGHFILHTNPCTQPVTQAEIEPSGYQTGLREIVPALSAANSGVASRPF